MKSASASAPPDVVFYHLCRRSEAGVYKDLIAQAHNGSGKTTCFALSMLSRYVHHAYPMPATIDVAMEFLFEGFTA